MADIVSSEGKGMKQPGREFDHSFPSSAEAKMVELYLIKHRNNFTFLIILSFVASCADHVTPSTRKSRHYFAGSGGRSVGIVRLQTKATDFSLFVICRYIIWATSSVLK
jgi:hypothetical protein